jgi:antitoxin YefM
LIKAVKQKEIVAKQGKIEINTTKYLLSTQNNKKELLEAIERVEKQENLITFTPDKWYEKYSNQK